MKTLKLNQFLIVAAFIGAVALPPFIYSALVDRKESVVETKDTSGTNGTGKQDAPIGDEPISGGQFQEPPSGGEERGISGQNFQPPPSGDEGNSSQQGGGGSGLFDFGKRTATWTIGTTSWDQNDHWVLRCPYDQTTLNEYPATSCRSCAKDFRVANFVCPKCGGDGRIECDVCRGKGRRVCFYCVGTGKKNIWQQPKYRPVQDKCWACQGTGKQQGAFDDVAYKCHHCNGTGTEIEQEMVPGSNTKKIACNYCNGTAEITCNYCNGSKTFRCKYCKGIGHFEAVG